MKKRKTRKPLKQANRYQKKRSIDQLISKPFLLSASIILSLIIVIYATYAWNTAADEKSNKFLGTRLSAEISEEFTPNFQWMPGTQTGKVIRVTNTGEAAAFVRVSLDEYLMAFNVSTRDNHEGVEKDGNGNLQITDTVGDAAITMSNFDEWAALLEENDRATYQYNKNPAEYYIGKESTAIKNFEYPEGSTEREATPLDYLTVTFTPRVTDDVEEAKDDPDENRKNNWFYSDGYFYFTSVLYPGEMTTPLTNGLTLSSALPNKYKGALYVMDVKLDAIDIFDGSLEAEWQLAKTNDVYKVLEDHVVK